MSETKEKRGKTLNYKRRRIREIVENAILLLLFVVFGCWSAGGGGGVGAAAFALCCVLLAKLAQCN